MDTYRDHPSEYDDATAVVAPPQDDVACAIGADERRMHVRAYNYWCSLLDGRDYPSIEDLEPNDIADFGPHSVLLDFTAGSDNPATPYIGSIIRRECDLADQGVRTIADVPGRSLLSRLTDHYMQIIANRAPVGFEAEFVNQRNLSLCYRGILMPFSSDGDTIDFIYGVINWKVLGQSAAPTAPLMAMLPPLDSTPDAEEHEDAAEHENEQLDAGAPHLRWEDGPLADVVDVSVAPVPDDEDAADLMGEATDGAAIDDNALVLVGPLAADEAEAGLADRLSAARESADVCKAADGRSRVALYRALAMAYDFAVAARRVPGDYAEILEDAGVKAQARAPMTPIVKLVFGADYDKTRLTEFAAALSNAEREGVDFGGFEAFLNAAAGGLKGLVAAERKARRPGPQALDPVVAAKAVLRRAAPLALAQLATNEEFALVLTRRNADGVHEVVRLVGDAALLERALRRVN